MKRRRAMQTVRQTPRQRTRRSHASVIVRGDAAQQGAVMRTWLIDGAARLPMDPELEALLSFSVASELEGGGIALNLGILNARGQVYRVARSWDLTDYIVACKALECVGLSLATKKPPPGAISFEDVFVRAPALDPAIAASLVVQRPGTRIRL